LTVSLHIFTYRIELDFSLSATYICELYHKQVLSYIKYTGVFWKETWGVVSVRHEMHIRINEVMNQKMRGREWGNVGMTNGYVGYDGYVGHTGEWEICRANEPKKSCIKRSQS
jgi:hypothetical protein